MADTVRALADLTEISTQIENAVVLDREGTVLAATVDDERAGRLAGAALELFRAAEEQREQDLVQLDAETTQLHLVVGAAEELHGAVVEVEL